MYSVIRPFAPLTSSGFDVCLQDAISETLNYSGSATMNHESNILYENREFYAFRLGRGKIEIRKSVGTYAVLLGTVENVETAIRFIDLAVRYPDRF